MQTKRKICVVTGSRAEYGLLYWVLRGIEETDDLELQLVVTCMHLSPEFGLTYRQIEKDGFKISRKVEILLSSDTPTGVSKSIGMGMIGFSDVYNDLKPDIVLMLGDRFELLAAATAALVAVLPIAHIHGGEVTEGAFDEAIRHSISKMSHLHFTSTEEYRRRIIQLGEHPDRVFNVGAPGLDNIFRLKLLDRECAEETIGMKLGSRSLLVAWHSVTLDPNNACKHFQELLNAVDEMDGLKLVFTKANADNEGRRINQMIDAYVHKYPNKAVVHTSLGQRNYLSVLTYVDGVVGNSSSGIIEAPSLKTGTINIGSRQSGRVRADSVIDCDPNTASIRKALERLFSPVFKEIVNKGDNPHGNGNGNVAEKILNELSGYPLDNICQKSFFDLPSAGAGDVE